MATPLQGHGRLLNGQLSLHDIPDVEAFCRRVLEDFIRRRGGRQFFNWEDIESCLTYLVALSWELSGLDSTGCWREPRPRGVYNPEWSKFSGFLYNRLRLRIVDWYRQEFWDTRSEKPEWPMSLDGLFDAEVESDGVGLESALASESANPEEIWDTDVVRLLTDGIGQDSRGEAGGGQGDAQAAA